METGSDLNIKSPTEDTINLVELCSSLWRRRKLIALAGVIGLGLSAIYAFIIAKPVYVSSALLLPTQSPSVDQLGVTAELFGKKSASSADGDLYQSLLTSRTVVRKLLFTRMLNKSDTANGAMQLLFQILKIDTAKPVEMETALDMLSRTVNVGAKESGAGGILEIKFEAGAPWLSQEIGEALLKIGQDELREVRAERASTVLPQLALAVSQAKAEWDTIARRVTWYRDRNRSIILPEQLLEMSRLQMEQQVQEQKYMLARREYETQVLEKIKAVPPMMILDPVNLPARKSKPKRTLILIGGLLFGVIGSCVAILGWDALAAPLKNSP